MAQVNKDGTLTVGHLLDAIARAQLPRETPISIDDGMIWKLYGVESFQLHTYPDGTKVLAFNSTNNSISDRDPRVDSTELFP